MATQSREPTVEEELEGGLLGQIEVHSIDWIPDTERHGKTWQQAMGVPAERPVQPAGQQYLVGHVEGHVGEQHGEQRDDDAAVTELGPGLDHLRQPEHRALGGVEGGTGTPEAGGLSSRELLATLRSFAQLNLVGADIVEVAPAYDHAQITGIAAAHVGYELLSALAARKAAPS